MTKHKLQFSDKNLYFRNAHTTMDFPKTIESNI